MKRFTIFHPLLLAFYSKPLYRDVKQNWQGLALLYLLLLSFISSLATLYHLYLGNQYFMRVATPYIHQLPVVSLQQGIASIDKPSPFFITNPDTQQLVAIIDTSGNFKSLKDSPAHILLTKEQLLIKWDKEITEPYGISPKLSGTYTQEVVTHLMAKAGNIVVVTGYILAALLYFVWNFLAILIFAGLAKLLTHTQFSYKSLCRIAAIALTPAILISLILNILWIRSAYILIVYLALTIIYLIYGIDANKEKTT